MLSLQHLIIGLQSSYSISIFTLPVASLFADLTDRCPPPLLRTAVCRHYRSCCPPPLSRTAVCRCYDRPLSAAAIAQTNHPVNTNLALCVMLLLQTAGRRYSLTTGRCRSRGLLAAVALANRWTPLLSRTACRLVHPPPATAAQVACRISVP